MSERLTCFAASLDSSATAEMQAGVMRPVVCSDSCSCCGLIAAPTPLEPAAGLAPACVSASLSISCCSLSAALMQGPMEEPEP